MSEPRRDERAARLCDVWDRRLRLLVLGLVLTSAGIAWMAAQGQALLPLLRDQGRATSLPFGALVLPGLACIGLWYAGVQRHKLLLATGTLAPAEVVYLERPRGAWPAQVVAGYRFRDLQGRWCDARQRVRMASPLGRRLHAGARGLWVVFEPGRPAQSRLIERAADERAAAAERG